MPLDTTFAPAQVDFSQLGQLGQDIGNLYKTRQLQNARNSAMKLMQGGDIQGGIAQLMGVGDTQGANALSNYFKATQKEKLNPLQEAQEKYWELKTAQLGRPGTQDKPTPQITNFCFANPNDPRCQQLFGGGTPDPTGRTPYPTAGGLDAPVPHSAVGDQEDPFKAFLPGAKKPLSPEDKEKHYTTVTSGLDAMIDTIDKIEAYDKDPSPIPGLSMLDYGTGMGAQIYKLGGTEGYNLKALQDQLYEQAKVTAFQDLKEASVNGASGFARAAVIEFNAIGNKIATVDPRQGKQAYIDNINKLKSWGLAVKQGLAKSAGISPGSTQSGDTETSVQQTPQTASAPQQADQPLNAPPVPGATQPIQRDPRGAIYPQNIDQRSIQAIAAARQMLARGTPKEQVIQWLKGQGINVNADR